MGNHDLRKLTDFDREQVFAYIQEEPEMNLFIFGDVERFGLEGDKVEVFVKDGPDGWDFLLLRYLESYLLYSRRDGYDAACAADFLTRRAVNIVSGKSILLEKLLPFFPDRTGQKTYMARLNGMQSMFPAPDDFSLRRLKPDDAAELVRLYLQIEEFQSTYAGREKKAAEELKINLSTGGRCWGAFQNGRLVAAASSSAENSRSAMIIGVATLPDLRRRGLAGSLVSKLCGELFSEGKQFVCLFYDNPLAGRIYRKIGFRELGEYMMIKGKREKQSLAK
ncbi:Acetyltransferase (GNAT) domain protein [Caprobacter fermentans]|uniref:Acetyltransferase (GNAT) domain protein n=1 Tax=Caproicibacter fermentans TaxID=2576756 RepID=A0A6N8I220_9FIRM|nr:GNAT family N-acetyltransferase [Caproicibacter fermentans]MVB11797.1 Acetyltransferase (GNAT) domain protein [Caproicibacter fermentans]QNK41721.1 GNAT family N-acetyltransferase [Caproicibacter fermentans]